MAWVLRRKRVDIRQLEIAEFEPRGDRTTDERQPGCIAVSGERGTLGGKPAARRDDHLKFGIVVHQRIAEPMRHSLPGCIDHVHIEWIASVEMPDFVGADPVPRRIGTVA